MIIVPIGHERGFVSRLPWVTLSIALLCIAMQVRASMVEPPILDKVERLTLQMAESERELQLLVLRRDSGAPLPGMGNDLPPELAELGVKLKDDGESRPESAVDQASREERIAALKERIQALGSERDAELERLPTMKLGYRPARDGVGHMLTSSIAHGGWMHLLGNLLFLYLVGCNIEDRWGRLRYGLFYLAAAVFSALSFRIWHPGSEQVLVGASGPIAAVMGAFAVCLSATRIRFFYAYWITFKPRVGTFFAPAWVALPLWFLEQALMSWLEASANLGVAYSAHVGGFLFGALVAAGMRISGHDQTLAEQAEFSSEDGAQWSDDPVFAEAKGLALEGHRAAALAAAEDVLGRLPDHADARELALKVALQLGDDERTRQHAAAAFTLWARTGKPERVLESYRHIREQKPELDLGESALRAVVTAASRDDSDALVAIDVAGQLIRRHPGSPVVPRAMWSAAAAQERLSRADLAQRTLDNLAATVPMDPFGEKARRKLHGESLRPPRSA